MLLFVIVLLIVYLMIREFRIMKNTKLKMESDLMREKLALLQQQGETKSSPPFARFSPEQIAAIKEVEDENTSLEINLFAKERLIDTRLRRLENYVKQAKLDTMMGKISQEEKKMK
jgi:DNA-binding transcriptional regulator of glucitol operon